MHLIVDAQALQTSGSRDRGIGRYSRNLVRNLAAVRPTWRVQAVLNAALPEPAPGALPESLPVLRFEPLLPNDQGARDANERFFGDWLVAQAPDAILELSYFDDDALVPQFLEPHPPVAGVAYDLIPLLFHETYLSDPRVRRIYAHRLRQFARADVILAISEATRADVIRLLRFDAARVVAISGAPEPCSPSPPIADTARAAGTLARLRIDRPFLLYVGGFNPRKNLQGTLAAFAALPESVRAAHLLVIVCALTSEQAAAIARDARRYGVEQELRLTNFVDDDVLQTLYRSCRLSLFPSFYEGLGLPVVEALLCGAPVVASNRSAIPEFAGPVSRLVDPSSPEDLAGGILATLAEPREQGAEERRRFAEGFQWTRTAGLAAAAIERFRRPARRPNRRPRVAWVSPLPPASSGIADYAADLLDRLPDEFDIEVVVDTDAAVTFDIARRFTVAPADTILRRHEQSPFDLFVYHLGNHERHIYMIDLMARCPGLTVIHDLYLGGLVLQAWSVGAWGDLAADLALDGAHDLAAAVRRGEVDHHRIAADLPLTRRFVETSEAVVVHSRWTWTRLRERTAAPVFRIAPGIPRGAVRSRPEARAALSLAPDRFLVVTVGEVTPAKRIDRLIEAVARLPSGIRERLEIVIVGEPSSQVEANVRDLAAGSGIAALRFPGRVPLAQIGDYARAADACVQLRYPTHGETSAAVLRALAAGAACVVSDTGSYAEIPDGVALRVRTPAHEVEDLAAALVRLHDDPGLVVRLGDRALRFVREEHDMDAAARQYAAAMHLTIARRRKEHAEWRAWASGALADAGAHVALGESVFEEWARVRRGAGR